MNSIDSDLDTKCENLMLLVVDIRKCYRKICLDYELKASAVENKLLNLQIETFSNCKIKPKYSVPLLSNDDSKNIDKFLEKQEERVKQIENLINKVKHAQEVIVQMKHDTLGRRLGEPFTAENMLAQAKATKYL